MLKPSVREELVQRTRVLVDQAKLVLYTPNESSIANLAWVVNVLVQELLAQEDKPLSNGERPAS